MSSGPTVPRPAQFDPDSWSDSSARDALRLIADSVTQMVGFEVVAVSLVCDDHFVSVAISGPPSVHEALADLHTPVELVIAELDVAEDWGRFKFVPHGASHRGIEEYAWVSDVPQGPEEDAWHPEDTLLAPLYDEQGALLGLLSIDLPVSGRRPDRSQRELLERYAAQTERALVIGVERAALLHRVRLAEATRQVVRLASSQPDVERALDDCRFTLLEGFRADEVAIRTYTDDPLHEGGSPRPALPEATRLVVRALSRACWAQQRAAVISAGQSDADLLSTADHEVVWDLIRGLGHQSAMLVPIGAGPVCLGHLILCRKDETVEWSPDERQSGLDVARDIGQAVLSARSLAREQRLVGELRELSSYKTELLSTVSHELKNPLGAITGHLELLTASPDLDEDARFSVTAMGRASRRLVRVVDDLLTLATVEDPDAAYDLVPVDLRPLLSATLDLAQLAGERRDLRIEVVTPPGPLLALGDEHGLDRVLTNLVSNAVKYTPRGGRICLEVIPRGDLLELSVSDDGIGISAADQDRLFTEFFRSTNPTALAEPGSGLGLAICARIVARHGGRIEVESALGAGSTFRVLLPTP